MTRAAGAPKRKPAQAPLRRTVHVLVAEGPYEGWEFTAYADFKAKYLAEFQGDDIVAILAFLDRNLIEHNFPDAEDPSILAASIGDVDNAALQEMTGRIFDAIGKLPNR